MTVTSDEAHAKIVESADSPAACVPSQNITVLYAYSTDIDYYTFWLGSFDMTLLAVMYTTLANVRFDTKQEEEIEYHSDRESLNASLYSHVPDSSLGYGNNTTGSNLYSVLKKFLNNKTTPICGAQVFIAVKRYPDESDVSDIIKQLRANHVMVYIAVDSLPSGGSNSASLYEMSYYTNGYCLFATTNDFALESGFNRLTWVLDYPYQFIAQNYVVSGSGRIETPAFEIPRSPLGDNYSLFAITVQNHSKDIFQVKHRKKRLAALDNSFVSMNYTIESTDGSYVYKFPNNQSYAFYGTAQSDYFYFNSSFSYKWTIDYHYNTNEPQIIQLRMYSDYYHDFLPLPDFK
ncbi:hypothetical protein CRE_23771 [Caenorhabditis remanei]|uniref:DUF7154 domain-containing protein n=1 Tax=Caenorhabditis remanei TaxID=31234 RepID=E3NJ44_CAERE|nr:hypothetical protein CRE_23771 [Caenorhabditis remanei]